MVTKIETKCDRFNPAPSEKWSVAKDSSPNPASYDHHKATDYTRDKSERCLFGKDKPIKFTDSVARLSISPGPAKHVPHIRALDSI